MLLAVKAIVFKCLPHVFGNAPMCQACFQPFLRYEILSYLLILNSYCNVSWPGYVGVQVFHLQFLYNY